jgi:hypothetical protein
MSARILDLGEQIPLDYASMIEVDMLAFPESKQQSLLNVLRTSPFKAVSATGLSAYTLDVVSKNMQITISVDCLVYFNGLNEGETLYLRVLKGVNNIITFGMILTSIDSRQIGRDELRFRVDKYAGIITVTRLDCQEDANRAITDIAYAGGSILSLDRFRYLLNNNMCTLSAEIEFVPSSDTKIITFAVTHPYTMVNSVEAMSVYLNEHTTEHPIIPTARVTTLTLQLVSVDGTFTAGVTYTALFNGTYEIK